jgi:hypothetical protein
MMAFRFPHWELSSTMDLNCKFFSKSDGTNPHPTTSKPINATMVAAAVVFCQFNSAKQQATKRIKSITIVTIFLALLLITLWKRYNAMFLIDLFFT